MSYLKEMGGLFGTLVGFSWIIDPRQEDILWLGVLLMAVSLSVMIHSWAKRP